MTETQEIPLDQFNKYERARVIGSRALQISMGAPFLIKFSEAELKEIQYKPLEIAKREFKEGVIPITVRRPLPAERVAKNKK